MEHIKRLSMPALIGIALFAGCSSPQRVVLTAANIVYAQMNRHPDTSDLCG